MRKGKKDGNAPTKKSPEFPTREDEQSQLFNTYAQMNLRKYLKNAEKL